MMYLVSSYGHLPLDLPLYLLDILIITITAPFAFIIYHN